MAKASDKAKEEKNPYDKDAVAKLFEDNYGPNLLHKLDVIKDQCEAGSFTLKRVSYYMKKIVGFVKTAAEASIKATNHEQEKKQRAEKDQMSDHLTGYQAIIDAMHQMFTMQLKWANDVQKEIVDRLGTYYRDFDNRRKKLIALEQKYLQKMEALAQKVKTERQNTLNAWQSLQEAEKAKEMADEEAQTAASNPKMVGKSEKKQLAKEEALRKQRIKTHKAFVKFEICVRDANDDQKHYYTKELPDLCKSFEMLELERMEELANRLVEFSRLQAELTTPLPGVTETIKKVVHVCDTKKCIKRFTKDCIDAYGKPPAVDPFVEGLPCTASLLEKDSPELTNLLQQDLKEVLASGKGPVRPASDKEHKAEEDFDLQDTQSPPDPEIVVVRAKFDFQQEDEDDIQFDPGDMIMITSPPTEYKKDEIGDEIKDGAWLQGVLMDSNHLDNAKPGTFPSNFVELAPVDADVTFRHFLEIPSGMRRFIAFLKTEFSQENMDFFYAVQEYRKADSDHLKRADDIVKKFVSEDADNMININSITKKQIEQALKTNTGVDRNLFNKAQKEIFELLSRDSFQRFKKTKSFHKYLEKRRKAELGKRFFSMDGGAQAHLRNPSSMFAVTGGLGSPSSPTSGASSTASPSS